MRGVLGLCVLRTVADGDTYGYAIAQGLERAGLGTVKGGTLYPLLSRFESAGLLEAQWEPGDGGPGRKHYRLTEDGHRELREGSARWARFADLTRTRLTGHPPATGPATTPRKQP
ncbi:MAG: PadR family transcriptional regulator [Actinobacteria bacterium]|nr:PadR family transcriptional regulator [Actinomycetota bacterium]